MEKENPFRSMAEKWPSSVVARSEIKKFTGGIISEKYLANLSSAGLGPLGRIRVGKKVAYPVADLIAWLEARSSAISQRDPSDNSPKNLPGKTREGQGE